MFFRNFILALLLLSSGNALFGQDWRYAYVHDPRGWNSSEVMVEEMALIIEPQGAYTQVDLTMSVSTDFSHYDVNDSLEVVLDFFLPEHAIVNDSWLWVGEDIIRAEIMDRSTATEIYESIVDRRQDPSLLTRFDYNDRYLYRLQIFPLTQQDHARKFRMSYLVPAQWNAEDVSTLIPLDFEHHLYADAPLNIKIKTTEEWGVPRLGSDAEITLVSDENGTAYTAFVSSPTLLESSLNVVFDTPFEDGIFFQKMSGQYEDFYQLGVLPSVAFDLVNTSKRTVVLIDYESGNSNLNKLSLLNHVRSFLKANLTEEDLFQVFFSNPSIRQASSSWMNGDDESIDNVFSSPVTWLANYSNIYPLLLEGIRYANQYIEPTNIVLISNTDAIGTRSSVDSRIQDIKALTAEHIDIHVLDYQSRNQSYNHINGIQYRGNAYFYNQLVAELNGNYKAYGTDNQYSFSQLFSANQPMFDQRIDIFDLSTSMDGGIVYERFSPFGKEDAYFNRPIFQIGKYSGDVPFKVTATALIDGSYFGETISFEPNTNNSTQIRKTDQMWAGHEVGLLEDRPYSTSNIQEIVGLSLDYRVLSTWTAFLALEPGLGGEVCEECSEDDNTVATEELLDDELIKVKVLPNPFEEWVQIQIIISEELDINDAQFFISDAFGRTIKTFTEEDRKLVNEYYEFSWDGIDASGNKLPTGVYYFTILTKKGKKTVKLMKQ